MKLIVTAKVGSGLYSLDMQGVNTEDAEWKLVNIQTHAIKVAKAFCRKKSPENNPLISKQESAEDSKISVEPSIVEKANERTIVDFDKAWTEPFMQEKDKKRVTFEWHERSTFAEVAKRPFTVVPVKDARPKESVIIVTLDPRINASKVYDIVVPLCEVLLRTSDTKNVLVSCRKKDPIIITRSMVAKARQLAEHSIEQEQAFPEAAFYDSWPSLTDISYQEAPYTSLPFGSAEVTFLKALRENAPHTTKISKVP